MKHLTMMALLFTFGVSGVYAHEKSVKMTVSGTSGTSATDLKQPGTTNGEDNFAGDGTLGKFTFRSVLAVGTSPLPSGTCPGSNQVYFPELSGAGVFRFEDGSLLNTTLTEGADCIDFVALVAHCTFTFQITGGTGRFKDASGVLTLTEIVKPVLADALNNPVFFAATGDFKGTISGVQRQAEHLEEEHQ